MAFTKAILIGLYTASALAMIDLQFYTNGGSCDNASSYVLYTNVEDLSGCINIDDKGLPFFADSGAQCGSYSNGGQTYGECGNDGLPVYSSIVRYTGGGAQRFCIFYDQTSCPDRANDFATIYDSDTCAELPFQAASFKCFPH